MNIIIKKKVDFAIKSISLSFIIIIFFLFFYMIIKNNFYFLKYEYLTNSTFYYHDAPRGNIYDRNHKLIVSNKLIPVIYYIKNNNISINDEIKLSYKLSSILDFDYSKVTPRQLKSFLLTIFDGNSLITDMEWNLLNYKKISLDDIYNIKLHRIDDSIVNYASDDFKKAAYIYNLLSNGYIYDIKEIKKNNLTDLEISKVLDNISDLPGIFIDYTYERDYLYGDTFKNIIGSVSKIPLEEKSYYISNGYSINDKVGTSYIEKQYDNYLKGIKGTYLIENGKIHKINDSKIGKSIVLTIDIDLQKGIDKILDEELIAAKNDPNTNLFNSVFVVIKNPKNGEILAMSGRGIRKVNNSYETYDLSVGNLTNSMTPGSVVKGASMLVAYKEKAINIGSTFYDNCVKIYSFPKKCSWKSLGYVNDIKALSYSSNVYQFKSAFKVAKFDYSYNKKIGDVSIAFNKYRKLFKEMGLGSKSHIDLPVDGIGNVGNSNSPDLYLNYVIGQYDTYTTMQLSEYISTIANRGERVFPHLLLEVRNNEGNSLGNVYYKYVPSKFKISVDKKYINRVRSGFREVLKSGLGINYMGEVKDPAGKTGTSESFYDSNGDGVIDTSTVSNAFVGYYPEDNPKMSIAITFPNIMTINNNNEYRSYANKRITKRIVELFDEMY